MSIFGECLEKLRRSRNLHQKQLAQMTGINSSYVSSLEKGHRATPSKEVLARLIEALNLTEEETLLLKRSIELTRKVVRVPNNISKREAVLLDELEPLLGSISDEKADIITKVLRLNQAVI